MVSTKVVKLSNYKITLRNFVIALDAMGGDLGPHVSLLSAKKILELQPNLSIIIVGDEQQIQPLVKSLNLSQYSHISFLHAPYSISMEDNPIHVLRQRKNSSMQMAIDLVATGKTDACVSAGNTGALMLLAKHSLKMVEGVSRPALVSALPNGCGGSSYFLDLGANLQCDSDILFDFALMGSVLSQHVEQIKRPRVALLNVGKENNKGNDEIKHAAMLLKNSEYINYVGFVEANELFLNKADVIVTDGFSGNISLKSYEGMGRIFLSELNKAVNSNFYSKLLGKLLSPVLKKQFKHLHPDRYNGASLIGLRDIVVKSHGSADEVAFTYAIEQAIKEIQWQIPACISKTLDAALSERDSLSHEQ